MALTRTTSMVKPLIKIVGAGLEPIGGTRSTASTKKGKLKMTDLKQLTGKMFELILFTFLGAFSKLFISTA